MTTLPQTQHDLRRVAITAKCDPRTVARRLAGRPQASTTVARIDEALIALGFSAPPPPAVFTDDRRV